MDLFTKEDIQLKINATLVGLKGLILILLQALVYMPLKSIKRTIIFVRRIIQNKIRVPFLPQFLSFINPILNMKNSGAKK